MPTNRPATSDTIIVRRADWHTDAALIRQVRRCVFIEELGIPAELEWDGRDAAAAHVLALDDAGNPVGTGRLLDDASLGRMAVLSSCRRQGVGRRLLAALMAIARQRHYPVIHLDAQTSVLNFYLSQGFMPTGPVFTKAGIGHQPMQRSI